MLCCCCLSVFNGCTVQNIDDPLMLQRLIYTHQLNIHTVLNLLDQSVAVSEEKLNISGSCCARTDMMLLLCFSKSKKRCDKDEPVTILLAVCFLIWFIQLGYWQHQGIGASSLKFLLCVVKCKCRTVFTIFVTKWSESGFLSVRAERKLGDK